MYCDTTEGRHTKLQGCFTNLKLGGSFTNSLETMSRACSSTGGRVVTVKCEGGRHMTDSKGPGDFLLCVQQFGNYELCVN